MSPVQVRVSPPRILQQIGLISHREELSLFLCLLGLFLDFVLSKYVENGVDTLDESKLANLILLKYNAFTDPERAFGGADKIRSTLFRFQKYLYQPHEKKEVV